MTLTPTGWFLIVGLVVVILILAGSGCGPQSLDVEWKSDAPSATPTSRPTPYPTPLPDHIDEICGIALVEYRLLEEQGTPYERIVMVLSTRFGLTTAETNDLLLACASRYLENR